MAWFSWDERAVDFARCFPLQGGYRDFVPVLYVLLFLTFLLCRRAEGGFKKLWGSFDLVRKFC